MNASPPQSDSALHRRPMGLRANPHLQALARWVQHFGITPNAVSLASIAVAAGGAACLLGVGRVDAATAAVLLTGTMLCVALRGLCNLIDGMVAIEGGRRTRSGEVFNDAPDRVSDLLFYAAAGYAALEQPLAAALGWAAAALAICTAYTRMLGGALGTPQYFMGPFAKPQRMAVFAFACATAAIERLALGSSWSLVCGLALIAAGCVITCWRRLRTIVAFLESP